MRHASTHDFKKQHKKRLADWLLYLPGAIVISYGLWLSLTQF